MRFADQQSEVEHLAPPLRGKFRHVTPAFGWGKGDINSARTVEVPFQHDADIGTVSFEGHMRLTEFHQVENGSNWFRA